MDLLLTAWLFGNVKDSVYTRHKVNEHGVILDPFRVFELPDPKRNAINPFEMDVVKFDDGYGFRISCWTGISGSSGPITVGHSKRYGSLNEGVLKEIDFILNRIKDDKGVHKTRICKALRELQGHIESDAGYLADLDKKVVLCRRDPE